LGFFTGPNPIVFIPVVRTTELSAFHQQIWERIEPLATDINPYYAPDKWTPHITLAYSDVTPENIACTMQKLTFQTYNWEIAVDNVSFIHGTNIQAGQVRFHFTLKGGTQ
jgi:2'-5' RNA ligase